MNDGRCRQTCIYIFNLKKKTPKLHAKLCLVEQKALKAMPVKNPQRSPLWKVSWFHHDCLESLRKHTALCSPSVFCKPLGSWPLSVPRKHGPMAAATTRSHDKLATWTPHVRKLVKIWPQSSPAIFPNFQLYLHRSQWMSSRAKSPVQTRSPKPPLLRFCPCLGHPKRVPPLQWAARGRPGAPRRHHCARRLKRNGEIRGGASHSKGALSLLFVHLYVCGCKNDLKIHHESQETIHSNYTKYYTLFSKFFVP